MAAGRLKINEEFHKHTNETDPEQIEKVSGYQGHIFICILLDSSYLKESLITNFLHKILAIMHHIIACRIGRK